MRTPLKRRGAQVAHDDAGALGVYVQVHLSGAAAGVTLFSHAIPRITDPRTRATVRTIRDELVAERRRLVQIAHRVGATDPWLMSSLARTGVVIGRLTPRGAWAARTRAAELVHLEAMRDAVAGKIAGWQALLSVVDESPALDRTELEGLLAQAERQHDHLTQAHARAAATVLSPDA